MITHIGPGTSSLFHRHLGINELLLVWIERVAVMFLEYIVVVILCLSTAEYLEVDILFFRHEQVMLRFGFITTVDILSLFLGRR